jgi:hypothetical protein
MAILYNLARMTTATTGTGTITLGAAVSGYLTFALAGASNGDVVSYAIKDGVNSEIGTGTYNASGTTLSRTVTKSTNANAAIALSGTAEVFITPRAEDLNRALTTQSLTSGTAATYTAPAGCTFLEVFMVGGGGGGGGPPNSGSTFVSGSDGTASSFNSVVANPGKGSVSAGAGNGASGGIGGTAGAGTATRRGRGGTGASGMYQAASTIPGHSYSGIGGSSYFAGGPLGVLGSSSGVAGIFGDANSGTGGSGGAWDNGAANYLGAPGGGAGEFVYLLISTPAATYTYTIGQAGAGGVGAVNGGNGGTGFIFVIEHYGN